MRYFIFLILPSLIFSHTRPFDLPTSYFPIGEGNFWVYKFCDWYNENCSEASFFIKVNKKGDSFFLENYFHFNKEYEVIINGSEVFFKTGDQKILIYKFEEGAEWYIPENALTDALCLSGSHLRVIDKNYTCETSLGNFENCAFIGWKSPCYDAGIAWEIFAPDIGLVERGEDSFCGIYFLKLAYAYVNGKTYGEPSLSFTLSLLPENLKDKNLVNLELKNNTEKEMVLIFPTSQLFDFILEDENGNEVYKWSEGKSFLPVLTEEKIPSKSSFKISQILSFPDLGSGTYYLKTLIPVAQIDGKSIKYPLTSKIPVFKY